VVSINLPVLKQVSDHCKTTNPPPQMLTFLQIVFEDFGKSQVLSKLKNKRRESELKLFLDSFFVTFVRSMPHHLHDEIFVVTGTFMDLFQGQL
jgi:hypothetical protein